MAELEIRIEELPGLRGAALVALRGSIDGKTALALKARLDEARARGLVRLAVDFGQVKYVNSTGLSYLIALATEGTPEEPRLALVAVQPKVKIVFDMLGLGSLFRFCATPEEGRAVLKGAGVSEEAPPPAPAPATPSGIPWYRNEDWLAVVVGFLAVAALLAGLRPALPRFSWSTDAEFFAAAQARRARLDRLREASEASGESALAGAARDLAAALDAGDRPGAAAASGRLREAEASAREGPLRSEAGTLSREVGERAGATLAGLASQDALKAAGGLLAAYLAVAALGVALLRGRVAAFAAGFPVVFVLAWLARAAAGNATVHYWGLEYVLFALVLGLLVSNVLGSPGWLREAARTEFYIKTGLVMLGADILFGRIAREGPRGLVQALAVVVLVWYAAYWIARRLRVDDELSVMLSTAVSICGVSAAIAACGAIQGDRRKLSYVTSLVLVVAAPMMVLMPWAVKGLGLTEAVGGAWIGGTLDTTGSVTAAAALVGPQALQTGVIVKFSQNVLLGLAAFVLSLWWAWRGRTAGAAGPGARVIWDRFPKFVLGFVAASLLYSFVLSDAQVAATQRSLKGLREVWFALAFVSIGLETRFGELFRMGGGRPALAFVAAQAVNVAWTLGVAWLLFGGRLPL